MKKEKKMEKDKKKKMDCNSGSSAIYGIGLIGALFYFISQASSFTGVLIGIVKAILWPGFLVYQLFDFLAY